MTQRKTGKLGVNQLYALKRLRLDGLWYPGRIPSWDHDSVIARVMDSLVHNGRVTMVEEAGRRVYRLAGHAP